jgi:putative aldouronate transport system substrate-binding protein
LFIDLTWLEACNLDIPTSLDDFLNMARAFKIQDPAGIGADKIIPIGGGFDYANLGYYFLNAMGYVDLSQSSTGLNPAIRNDDCELPCGNPDLFYEYLKVMRACYEEGLFSSDYFVLDSTGVNAQLNSGRIGVVGVTVYTVGLESWADWMAAKPLTSQWSDTPRWPTPPGANIGGFAMAADTQLAELGLRFANCYFSTNYLARMLWIAPADGHEEAMGYTGRILNDARNWTNFDTSKFPDGITDVYTYLISYIAVQPTFGTVGTRATTNDYVVSLLGGEEPGYKQFDVTTPDQHYRAGVWQNIMPFCAVTFPRVFYLDEETTIRMSDLSAVIGPYVNEQVALFISGDRSLDEFNLYLNELKAIGFDEYQQIYKDIWNNYKEALEG